MRKPTRPLACLGLIALACFGSPAQALGPEQFEVHNTQDIIELCSTAPTDPLYVAAIHFCHGYLIGAYHYQDALYKGPGIKPVVCLPTPTPTRNEGIAQYLAWAKAHPEYGKDRAVDSLSKFLAETWPCKN
ncbi:MAG: Rap1a/Tai family immunity protein [Candidatus Methylumidiphilus sp.]